MFYLLSPRRRLNSTQKIPEIRVLEQQQNTTHESTLCTRATRCDGIKNQTNQTTRATTHDLAVQEGLQRSTAQQENQIFTTKDGHRRCADANLPSFVLLNGVCTGGALTLVAFVFALAAVLAREREPTPPVTTARQIAIEEQCRMMNCWSGWFGRGDLVEGVRAGTYILVSLFWGCRSTSRWVRWAGGRAFGHVGVWEWEGV